MNNSARAVADLAAGEILASVEIAAAPARVFEALISEEVTQWWVRPGVFDTQTWHAEPRVGGRWQASGVGRGQPYTLEGEFLEVEAPRRLAHSWQPAGRHEAATRVTYLVEEAGGGARLTLRHVGFKDRQVCAGTCTGWETSLEQLAAILEPNDLQVAGRHR